MFSTLPVKHMEDQSKTSPNFTRNVLPWLVAAGALLAYLATLNHWVTLTSLPLVAKVTGWDWWNPAMARPLFTLVTWPIHWLPAGWQLVGLNAFSAVCSALTLALLARSVALLPHDRTRDQRQRERGEHGRLSLPVNWLPPLLAALVCGLQLTFWEHATVATGEALDLLLFAYCIRCLLEFRRAQKESWLAQLAFVYGLAVSGNWAMIGFFPCFVVALVWIKGRSCFQGRFLGRMVLYGFAGLLLYLVSPLLQLSSGNASGSFWQLLRNDLATQKMWLAAFPRSRTLLLSLTSLLPLAVMGIRWPTNVGDSSPTGVALTNFMFRVVHLLFLVVCGWVAFDPIFSPRELGYGLAFLPLYYLGALAVGYFSGWLLLVFGVPPGKMWDRPSPLIRAVNRGLVAALWIAVVAAPLLLVKGNLPRVQAQNGPALRQFADAVVQALPKTGALVLSDTSTRLQLLAASMHGKDAAHVLLDTRWLTQISYHRQLAAHYPGRWPAPNAVGSGEVQLPAPLIAQYLAERARTNELFYLHPAAGMWQLENVYLQPHGLVLRALPYAENAIVPPPLSAAEIFANEKVWTDAAAQLTAVRQATALKASDGAVLGGWYSLALNHWGVELQRLGKLAEAGERFAQAGTLATNPVAEINQEVNTFLRTNRTGVAAMSQHPRDLLSTHRTWGALLANYGPFDEPAYCFQLGQVNKQAGLRRQAAIEFLRAQTLNPTNLATRLALAETFLEVRLSAPALEVTKGIRDTPAFAAALKENDVALVRLEALAFAQQTNVAAAVKLLSNAQQRHPKDDLVPETLFQIYLQARQLTNALAAVAQQLLLAPESKRALLNQGAISLELKAYAQAVAALDRLLKLDPSHVPALINRGQALMGLGKLDEAQRDFEALRQREPGLSQGHLGLAELALRRKNNAEALRQFEAGLLRVPAGTPQAAYVTQKIKELKGIQP